MRLFYKGLFIAFILLLTTRVTNAQLTGAKNIPGDYATISAAVTALNLQGVGAGGVTFNVAAGYTETAPVGGISLGSATLNATLSATNIITIQKSGVGANPVITAYTGGTVSWGAVTPDGIFRIVGADYISIDGIDLAENAANTTTAAMMEYGYALFKASVSDGCQNITIKNCTITLNRQHNETPGGTIYAGSLGILMLNAMTADPSVALTPTGASGTNSNNKFYSNTIQNCNMGIVLGGYAPAATGLQPTCDVNNDIGGSSASTGNTIINFGGATGAIRSAQGIVVANEWNSNISYNTINNNTGTGVNHIFILKGISHAASSGTNVTIGNNTITLKCGSTTNAVTAIENIAGATSGAGNITISNNTITNCTYTTATSGTFSGIVNSTVAANLNIVNNTLSNNATNATSGTTLMISNSGAVTTAIVMDGNNINGMSYNAVTSGAFNGIFNSAGAAAATLSISNNNIQGITYTSASSGANTYISNTTFTGSCNINSNTFTNLNVNTTGAVLFITNSVSHAASTTINVNNNSIVTAFNKGGASGAVQFYLSNATSPSTVTENNTGNNFSNIAITGTATIAGWQSSDGSGATGPTKTVSNNTFANFTAGTGTVTVLNVGFSNNGTVTNNTINNINTGGTLTGLTSASGNQKFFTNTISGLSSTGSSVVTGITISGGTAQNIYRNKIYNLSSGNTGSTVNGILISTVPTTINVYNNLIGDLRTPTASGNDVIRGISCTATSATTSLNVSFNSIYLNASSTGANFGTSGIFHTTSTTATTANLTLRNNIIVNTSTPAGTGFTVAFRRSSGAANALSNYNSASNNNLFYAGTPGTGNLIYYDGTSSAQTLVDYKSGIFTAGTIAPRDVSSITQNPPFISTNGPDATFLHINPATPTPIESGGVTIAGITDDFDGDTRNVSTPDIGADEGTFISIDLNPPVITYTPLVSSCTSGDRTLSVTIGDASGVPVTGSFMPKIYFRKNGGAWSSGQGSLSSGTAINGVWSFTISATALGGLASGNVVDYYVVAQDINGYVSASPSAGFSATNVNTIITDPTIPNTLTILPVLNGSYTVGATGVYPTLTAAINAYNTACISGPVVFQLTDPLYNSSTETFPIVINANASASAINTLTIRPASGMVVEITGAAATTSLFKLLNAKYVTIDGVNAGGTSLTLTQANTAANVTGIWLASTTGTGGCSDISLKNMTITGSTQAQVNYWGILAAADAANPTSGTAGKDNDNITIQGNNFTKWGYAIWSRGTATVSAGGNDAWVVTGNTFGPVSDGPDNLSVNGVFFASALNANFSNNTFQNIGTTTTTNQTVGIYFENNVNGLMMSGNNFKNIYSNTSNVGSSSEAAIFLGSAVINVTLSRNVISSIYSVKTTGTTAAGARAITVNNATAAGNVVIANNMISDIYAYPNATNTSWPAGISIDGSSGGVSVYHNTVNLSDVHPGATTTGGGAIALFINTTGTNIDIRNNILSNSYENSSSTSHKSYAIISTATSGAQLSNINYNNYFVSGPSGILASINAIDRISLADIQAGFGGNASSMNTQAYFVSPTDLHLVPVQNGLLNDKGTPIAGITTDIDNDVRSATVPDMGADEFNAPAGVDMAATTLVTPALKNCYSNAEVLTVRIQNASGSTIDFTTKPVTITLTISGPGAPGPLQTTISTGTLASGATQDVVFSSTLNMSVPSTYTFNANTSVAGDINPANNAMTPVTREVVALTPGIVAADNESICVSGTPVLTLTGNAGGTIQWQQSTNSATGPWTDIGTNSNGYTPAGPITTTTHYRVVVSCGASNFPSNVVSVIVNNPQVLTTTPGTRCGPGTVTLGATTGVGSQLNWYSAVTGGLSLGTGTSFTTPVINTTTTYYVSAGDGGATQTANHGLPTVTTTTQNTGLLFDLNVDVVLNSVDVYTTTSASDVVITLYNSSGVLLYTSPTFNVPAGSLSTPQTLNLNWAIPAGTNYRILVPTHTAVLGYHGGTFPIPLGNGVGNITTGATATGTTTLNYFIYNMKTTSGCSSARVPVIANIATPPAINASATSNTICAGQSTQLSVTSANPGYTYVWNPGNITGATTTVSPALTTAYTVTATDISGGANNGCTNTATVNITANPVPSAVSITPSSSTFCSGGPAQLLTSTGGNIDNHFEFGTQANQNVASTTITGFPAPYTVYYGGQRMQILVTAAELTAAGFGPGSSISNVEFPVVSFGSNWGGSTTSCQSFQVSIGHTSLTSMTAFQTGLTQVVAPANFTPTVGYSNTHNFSAPFIWNGTSNIILETTFSNNITGTTNDLVTQYNSPTAFQSTIVYRADGVTPAAAASSTTITFSYSARPDFKLNGTNTSVITWAPLTGLFTDAGATIAYTGTAATSVYARPATTQTYTATATNSYNCTNSGSATLTITAPPSATIAYAASPYCVSGGTATVTRTGSTGGVYSSTAGLSINSTTGDINLGASTAGTYTITYTVAGGGCPQFQTTASITINAAPSATITYVGSPFCINPGTAAVTLTGTTGGSFSSTTGLVINSTTGQVDLGTSTAGTYTVTYTVAAANGCAQYQTTTSISIVTSPTATISYAGSPYCSNATTANITRNGSGGGVYSSTTGLSIDAATGAVNISASTPGTYTVTYFIAANGGCTSFTTTTTITITPAPGATISYTSSPYCSNGGSATVTQTGSTGGVYSSTGGLSINSSTGAINLGSSTAGTYTVTYTVAAANGCAVFQTTATITITGTPSATISYAGSPYCNTASTGNVTRTGTAGGTYSSTTGLSINATTGAITPGTSTPGTYTVTYTVAAGNGCSQFQTTTNVTITAAPSATISYGALPYCSNGGSATVTQTGTTGGTYSSTAGLSINASTGAVNLGSTTAGTYTVTYTVAAANGCAQFQTTATITITAAAAATISYPGTPYCGNSGTANVTLTGTVGGTYSSTTGLSINTTTGAITPGTSTPGTYTVTYTVAGANGCAQFQTTANVTITAAPSATISYAGSPYCSSAGAANVTVTGTTGGVFSSTTGLSLNTTTGAITPGTSTPGTYLVTYTVAAANGCAQFQVTTSVTITAAPSAAISYVGSPFCISGGTANVTQTGSIGGTYSSTTGLSINATTGAITPGTSTPGTYTITYTVAAANGCAQLQVTTNVTVLATGNWTGTTSSDWNNANNWCGGIPTSAMDVTIPATAPNMPNLSAGNGSVRSITINNGATLTIGAGGILDLYGNITGAGTFNATAGSIAFRGTTGQTIPAFTATNMTMNGAGGLTPGGNSVITGTLTLTNGNITLGSNNLSLSNSATGSVTSHIITNGTGQVTVTNLAATQSRTVPVGNDATSYNPVTLVANAGHTTDNITVRVKQGVYENGVSGTTYTTHVADRMWIINEGTVGGSNVNVLLQWAASQELPSFDRAKCYVMQHNGTDWVRATPTAAGGTGPYTQVKTNVTSFSPFAVETERIPRPTTGIYPNPTPDYLNVVTDLRQAGPVIFKIYDSKGSLVYQRKETLSAGLSQTTIDVRNLSEGIYLLKVSINLDREFIVQRFIKGN